MHILIIVFNLTQAVATGNTNYTWRWWNTQE